MSDSPPRCGQWDPFGHDICILEKGHGGRTHSTSEMRWIDSQYLTPKDLELWPRGRPNHKITPAKAPVPKSNSYPPPGRSVKRPPPKQSPCFYCDEPALGISLPPDPDAITMDHVIPLSRGGKKGAGNRVWACYWCNTSKSNILLDRWIEALRKNLPFRDPIAQRKALAVLANHERTATLRNWTESLDP